LDDGWISPFNGYQYKLNPNEQVWDASRSVCQSRGGDLIVHGFRDYAVKETITRALRLTDEDFYWIGLSDKESEGNWVWVNGNSARTDDATLWHPGEPNNVGNQDCGAVRFMISDQFLAYDNNCFSWRDRSICEKLI